MLKDSFIAESITPELKGLSTFNLIKYLNYKLFCIEKTDNLPLGNKLFFFPVLNEYSCVGLFCLNVHYEN